MNEKINLLFVCRGNTCRSQMAEGFAMAYGDMAGSRSGALGQQPTVGLQSSLLRS